MRIIQTRAQLIELARELSVRGNWHEPDEQGVTARVEGGKLDNAGFWPTREAMRHGSMSLPGVELHVVISRDSAEGCDDCGQPHDREDVAAVNLASLLAWASGGNADS